jgi:hypothetical protein
LDAPSFEDPEEDVVPEPEVLLSEVVVCGTEDIVEIVLVVLWAPEKDIPVELLNT